ncbi:CD3337/EF1877 family mobilome membrane protein [Bacillus sp. FSL K6-0268]|uniref:CD3337/EF1877 family mobilome membrane protein n=1 Tax=Bacillus sp. FSL K6-0268 TaxID=2921449 RepID=UPI0030F585EC
MKKILSLCMIFAFLLMPLGSSVTLAEEEKKQEQPGPRISESLFQGHTDEVYKDKYYEIDTETPKKDDKGVLQKLGGYIFGDDSVGQDLQRMIYSTCQWFVNLAFKLNIMLTQLTIFLVDQALKLDIVSAVADKLATAMQNISGIGEGEDGKMGFLSGGLFPSIIGLTCMLSACYAAYIFFVKRQPTAGLNELVKTVLVITFILVFIGNAGTVLKTANTISSEISTIILAKSTGTVAGDPNRSQEAAISSVKKQIWGILVERPYLFLQYGEDSKEKIGKDRVDTLLKTPIGEARDTIVGDEIQNKKNQMMKMDSVGERIIFTIIYYIVNPFVGLPILVFCLLIVAFQLWFLVMSLIAPIVLAVALLPGHRKVLESWAKQWVRPLALKMLMSVMLVIIFTVSELIYVLPEAGLAGYVSTMIFQIIVFVLCYIFRDNIAACFQKTKNIYKTVTDISLMTESFANRGKEVAMDAGSAAIERIGDHFNTAAELAAVGDAETPVESQSEKDRKPHLAKANVPEDLADYQDKEKQEEKHGRKLIPLKSEEQAEAEEQHATQEETDESGQKPLARLDQSELDSVMEQTEEATSPVPEDMEDANLPPHYVSLEEGEKPSIYDADQPKVNEEELADPSALDIIEYPTNEMPIEQESIHLPQQEHHTTTLSDTELDITSNEIEGNAITPQQEDIHNMLPNDPTSLHSVSVPDLIPAKVDEEGRIIPQHTDIDVKSTIPQPVVETSPVSTPSETVSIPDLIPARVTEQGEILPQQEIEIPSPPVIPDAIAAGSESWNLPASEPKQLERLEPNKED